MKKVFDYLDRFYLKDQKQTPMLIETSLILFRDNVFKTKLADLRTNILNEIEKDRLDQDVDKDVIRSAIL
jgi:cullin 1